MFLRNGRADLHCLSADPRPDERRLLEGLQGSRSVTAQRPTYPECRYRLGGLGNLRGWPLWPEISVERAELEAALRAGDPAPCGQRADPMDDWLARLTNCMQPMVAL